MEKHAKCMSSHYPRQKILKLNVFPYKEIVIYTEILFGVPRHFFQNQQKRARVTGRFPVNDIHTYDIDIFSSAKLTLTPP